MKIRAYPYTTVKDILRENQYWISIQDLGYDYLYRDINLHKNKIVLKFDDITPYHVKVNLIHQFYKNALEKRPPVYFDEKMAKKIHDFADSIANKTNELYIHCWAGMSRSQGIGSCLNVYFNLYKEKNIEDFKYNIETNQARCLVNPHVTRILNNELFK